MKPRLYEQNEMLFEGGGICALHDAVSCEVTEELNGAFELRMKYPVSGDHFTQLKTGRMILAKPSAWEKPEPFHIYAISKPLMGLVTVYAEHVSYFTNKIVCAPFSASNIAEAVLMLQHSAVNENPFTLSTDMAVVNDLNSNVPITMRHGIIGRIVSLYGGEVKCEGWNIRILGKRGADRGFSIRYGGNLVDMKQDEDISGIYDGVYPYYNVEETEETDAVYVELPEKVILLGTHSERIKPINLTAEFTEEPTEEELRAKTLEYLEKNDINAGVLTIEVEFALLSQTEEYRNIMALEDVRLGDVISVFVPKRGITVKSRCVKTVYDVMRNRYVKVTIGDIGKDITYSFISYEDRLLSSETRIGEQGATIAKLTVKTSAMSAEISGIAEWIGDEDGGMTKTIATLSA
jgi:phage minor structural protein